MIFAETAGIHPIETETPTWAKHFADQRQGIQLHLNALEIQEARLRSLGLLDKPVDYLDLWGIKNSLQEAK